MVSGKHLVCSLKIKAPGTKSLFPLNRVVSDLHGIHCSSIAVDEANMKKFSEHDALRAKIKVKNSEGSNLFKVKNKTLEAPPPNRSKGGIIPPLTHTVTRKFATV
ncbi:MAG TPA: hypothetical protein HPQ00_17570 [Magnetococcales bacterium]|nr:hypothetical protein [Magnetococcales bacterium]